ncbi:hypothetical protein [Burkholderia multivorans]|uniref:hypothetical protein n=1 Tax=Burkholderia multivorans TaxID=87883 RepID=UPI0019D1140E|nr:hypothetical protein [Burkholderia multivorans]MBN6728748.1 hypothetical protein [Burkholderia multivorans]
MAEIDVKKLRELARRLRDTQADCADSIEAADAIVALCDRLEAAEKDAERYRWIRAKNDDYRSDLCVKDGYNWVSDLDGYIDAALAQ